MKSLKFFVIVLFSLSMALFTSSCGEEEPGDGGGNVIDPGPILLECAYFTQEEDRVLVNDPARAVDYVVPCKAHVDVDVIIEAGTVIEFETEAGLSVRDLGSLSAVGTSDEMIVFTGVGKTKGSWAGINFISSDNNNQLSYCHINYGGGYAFSSNGLKANIIALNGSKSSVDNCIIENSFSYGVDASGRESHFNSFKNNSFKNNETPIYANASAVYLVDKTNTFEGNTNSYVEVGAGNAFLGLSGNTLTWQDLDVPYFIVAEDFGNTREISIRDGKYLILEPGVELVFSANTQITIDGEGALKAAGEEGGKQILMTGAEPIPGFWNGIEFYGTKDPRNEISHATLEYGAGPNLDGMILMTQDPKITVHNVTFRDLENCAFYEEDDCFCNDNLTEYDNTFENVGGTYCFDE